MSLQGSRSLVTGGLGFLVSNLAIRLVEEGADVTLVDAKIPEYGGNLANIAEIHGRVHVNFADIRDRSAMHYLLRGTDVVFHLAGQASHVMSLNDPFPDIDINIGGTTMVLDGLRGGTPSMPR